MNKQEIIAILEEGVIKLDPADKKAIHKKEDLTKIYEKYCKRFK